MAMTCVFGSLLSTAIGTTAPFSAISGAVISIALLRVDPLPPSAFIVSATLFVSNAALFHSCASASPGLMIPEARGKGEQAAAGLQHFAPLGVHEEFLG